MASHQDKPKPLFDFTGGEMQGPGDDGVTLAREPLDARTGNRFGEPPLEKTPGCAFCEYWEREAQRLERVSSQQHAQIEAITSMIEAVREHLERVKTDLHMAETLLKWEI